eukprot:m.12617 g.12617  ORF g.12617 m.12617 type:complete len:493 (-) comp4565_c0_seq1:215-1693(-)
MANRGKSGVVTTSMPVSTKVVGTAGPGAAHPPPPLSPPVEAVPKNPFPHFNSNLHVSVLVAKKKRCEEDIVELEAQLQKVESRIAAEKERLGIRMNESEILQIALQRFNHSDKPKTGIQFLIENKYFSGGGTPEEVARFLFAHTTHDHRDANSALEKTALGEYLGEGKPFNMDVLRRFTECFPMAGMSYVEALRNFLWAFRMPGEGQKVDRFMNAFAVQYFKSNYGKNCVFKHEDACYTLAFSTMMLQTALHNPQAGRSMDLASFTRMNHDMNCQTDEKGDLHPKWDPEDRYFPKEFLEEVFNAVAESEFKVPGTEGGVGYTFMNPDKEGYLFKQGGSAKRWAKRWVVVKAGCLYYFASEEEYRNQSAPVGIVPLDALRVCTVDKKGTVLEGDAQGDHRGPFFFALRGELGPDGKPGKVKGCKTKNGVVVQGNHKEYLFRSESAEQVKDWVQCIEINLTQIKGNHGFNFAESYIRNSSLPRRSHIEDVALSP